MNAKKATDKSNLQIVATIIGRELGLSYPTNRFEELLRGFERTSELFQGDLSAATIIEEIIKSKSIPKHIYTKLSNALTINETYFFREVPAINLFKTVIINEIEAKNGNYKIWSAGCSSGEEPFTLAILIKEALPTNISKNIQIIATDLSDNALSKAKEGVYTDWSFRETPISIKNKYFKAIDGKWHICEEIKNMVSFSHLNLITEEYPSLSKGINNLNLIFCRNVLMYFSLDTIKLVTNKLYNSLSEGGWLVTSQVELNNELFPDFGKANFCNGFFYKREKALTFEEEVAKEKSSRVQKIHIAPKKRATKEQNAQIELLTPTQRRAQGSATLTLDNYEKPLASTPFQSAKELANKGEYDNALVILEKLSSRDSFNLDFSYLYATILAEKGDIEGSAEYYKKCIYLQPTHILANYMLANLYVELGKKELSLKYFRTALKEARKIDSAKEIPESGGMSAARVVEILEQIVQEQ